MTEANGDGGEGNLEGKKTHPTRGKRYSTGMKKEILESCRSEQCRVRREESMGSLRPAFMNGARAAKRRGNETGDLPRRNPRKKIPRRNGTGGILAMWRQHRVTVRVKYATCSSVGDSGFSVGSGAAGD